MHKIICNKSCMPALQWITDYLHRHQIPYLITGGLAAIAYGSTRPLADIDLYVPEDYFHQITIFSKDYIIEGPARYRDDNWDLNLVELEYQEQSIEIAPAGSILIFNQNTGIWQKQTVDFNRYTKISINDLPVKVMDKTDPISYKKMLARNVDLTDITAIS